MSCKHKELKLLVNTFNGVHKIVLKVLGQNSKTLK